MFAKLENYDCITLGELRDFMKKISELPDNTPVTLEEDNCCCILADDNSVTFYNFI